jgi:hypothetical protein
VLPSRAIAATSTIARLVRLVTGASAPTAPNTDGHAIRDGARHRGIGAGTPKAGTPRRDGATSSEISDAPIQPISGAAAATSECAHFSDSDGTTAFPGVEGERRLMLAVSIQARQPDVTAILRQLLGECRNRGLALS